MLAISKNEKLSDKNYRCFQCKFGFTTFEDAPGTYRCDKLHGKKAEEIDSALCPRWEIEQMNRMMRY